jgi:hypothetical protein
MKLGFFLFAMAALSVQASTVYVESNAATFNDSGYSTVEITPFLLPSFPGSHWITAGYPSPGSMVTFTTDFELEGSVTGASLFLMTGDPVVVLLNGHALGPGGNFALADFAAWLISGNNTLAFRVAETQWWPRAIDFTGSFVTSDAAAADPPVPEPAVFGMIGIGLAAIALIRRRR